MKLCAESLKDRKAWSDLGVTLPAFDYTKMAARTKAAPVWIHFGAGNIFRGFIAALGQELLNQGVSSCGILAAETFDYDIIDRIYTPFDNLTLLVSLLPDGSTDKKIVASIAEGVKADFTDGSSAARLRAAVPALLTRMALSGGTACPTAADPAASSAWRPSSASAAPTAGCPSPGYK